MQSDFNVNYSLRFETVSSQGNVEINMYQILVSRMNYILYMYFIYRNGLNSKINHIYLWLSNFIVLNVVLPSYWISYSSDVVYVGSCLHQLGIITEQVFYDVKFQNLPTGYPDVGTRVRYFVQLRLKQPTRSPKNSRC